MKKSLLLLSLLLALVCAAVSCSAEIIPPYGEGQIGLEAVVLCESLTVRSSPSASAAAVKTIPFGTRFSVQKQENGWADCFLSDDVDAGLSGWVSADYILVDPAWYKAGAATPVYAYNSTSAPRVALLSSGTLLPIVSVQGDWLVVSLRGATGWIVNK